MKAYPEPEGGTKGSLLKRKDFIGVDHLANSHPNRTYYYRKNEDENDIINTCTRKLQNDPNNTKALFLRGSTYAKKSLYQDSISDFDALLRVDPSHADGLYCRAMSLSKVNQPERAIDDFTKVLALKPDHYKAAFHRAGCYNLLGRLLEAIEDYNFALMKDDKEGQGNSGGSVAPTYQGDDFSMTDMDTTRTTYQNDGDSSPPFVLRSERNRASSGAAFDGSGSDSGNMSPLSVRSSGKFSNYHQYSPAATPTTYANANSSFAQQYDSNNNGHVSTQSALSGRAVHSSSAVSLDSMVGNVTASESHSNPNRRAINPSTPAGRPGLPISTPVVVRPGANNTQTADFNQGNQNLAQSNQYTARNILPSGPSGSTAGINNTSSNSNTTAPAHNPLAEEHHARGYQLRKKNDFSGAVLEYSKAIEVDPSHFRALFNRGFAHDKLGLYDLAIADYTRAIDIDAANAFSYYNRGISHDKQGSLDAAWQDFTTAINLQSKNAEFYQNRAFCLRRMGKLAAAVEDYSVSLKLSPNNFKSLYNRAMCYDKMDKLDLALEDCNAALSSQPTHAACMLVKANILERFNRLPEALECLSTALANGSDALPTLIARGKLLRIMGVYSDAIRDLSAALELQPGDVTLLSTRGMCYKAINQYVPAVQDFSAVVAQDPQNIAALNHRGYCYRKLEDFENSIADYTKCIQLSPANLRAYNNRAYIFAGMSRFREALADYNTVLQHDPTSVHAYHNRGMLYDKMGMIDQAIADFSKVLELEPQGQSDSSNQQSMSNRQAAQLALEALQQQLHEKTFHTTGPPTVELGLQSGDSSLGRLLSAQALLSQVPGSASATSTRPGPKTTSINSLIGSIQVQNGTFYPPRGGLIPPTPSTEVRPASRFLDRQQTRESPTEAGRPEIVGSSPPPPSVQPRPNASSAADQTGPDLSNRLNEVSNLLKGFGTQFVPTPRSGVAGQANSVPPAPAGGSPPGAQRSTTPLTYQINRRAAANVAGEGSLLVNSGLRNNSAGIIDGAPTYTSSLNKPNFYRAPVPVQPAVLAPAKPEDVQQRSTSALLSIPVHASSPVQTPMRPLPAAIVPTRYQNSQTAQSSALCIDTSANSSTPYLGTPSTSTRPIAESPSMNSTSRSGPVSAATFLNSLPKPTPVGPPSSQRSSVQYGAGVGAFSPRVEQQFGDNGAGVPQQGKFSLYSNR